VNIVHLTPGGYWYRWLADALGAEPLRSQWWNDAESTVDDPAGASYLVAVEGGEPVAWAGYIVDGDTLRCCNNYVRRGRNPDLYARVYAARHDLVVTRLGLPAVTYLFAQPIGLHKADGWVEDTGPDAHGVSRAHPDGEDHPWWRLLWTPPAG
jgi:hypothetical protein